MLIKLCFCVYESPIDRSLWSWAETTWHLQTCKVAVGELYAAPTPQKNMHYVKVLDIVHKGKNIHYARKSSDVPLTIA